MITPLFTLDSREAWRPVPVDESLALFGYVWEDGAWRLYGELVDRLDFPAVSPGMEGLVELKPTGYVRVVAGGGLIWWQWWLWFIHNSKTYAGFGEHEGDWEMVQLGCKDEAGDEPVLMTVSQHDGGEKREHWRVELQDDRPHVQIARDSHAHYFTVQRDVTDQADGKGPTLDLEWREFGEWAAYPGKWGGSDTSPGPLPTRRAWTSPHLYHSQAHG